MTLKKKVRNKIAAVFVASTMVMTYVPVKATSVSPNSSFSGSASCGVYEGPVSVSGSNATVTSADNFCERGGSVSASAQAGSSGTATISFVITDAVDTGQNPPVEAGQVTIGSTSVSVAEPTPEPTPTPTPAPSNNSGSSSSSPATKTETPKPEKEPEDDKRSKDNTLSALSIDTGTLSPKFSSSKTSYKVDLPATAESITVKATPNDGKASVSGTGKIKLKAGANEINIVCTSEYGTTKTYTITVNVDEKPLIYTTYNNKKLGVVRSTNGVKTPAGFKATKVKLDGKEIEAWKNEKIKKTIVYLSDEKNNKNFYLFEDGKITSEFEYKKVLDKEVFLIDVPADMQKMEGMKYGKVTIDKIDFMGWTFEDESMKNYSVIYVMDMDGVARFYQYESTQKTLQIYSGAAPVTQKVYAQKEEKLKSAESSKTIWMSAAIVLGVLAVARIGYSILLMKKSKENK